VPFFLAINAIGAFILDENNKIAYHDLFYPDAEQAAAIMRAVVTGETNDTLDSLAGKLAEKGFVQIVTEDQMMARAMSKSGKLDVGVEESSVIKWFRQNQQQYLKELGVMASPTELGHFVRQSSVELAKSRVSAAVEEKDLLVKNAADAVDEIDKSINVLVMRLREWYSLHHPGLSQIVEEQELFARVLKHCCGKSSMTERCLKEAGLTEQMIEKVMTSLVDVGAPMSDSDLTIMQGLARSINQLYKQRTELETYVTNLMEEVAPNMSALAGPLIGARLISIAGSLKELARKPSSTIQVFGAERALFRSIKTGTAPPKHGIIYRVPEINTAPYWIRGKVARALAGKLSIAARIDAYSNTNMGEELRKDFLARVDEIKRQNPEPPKETKPPPQPKPPAKKRQSRGQKGRQRKGGQR
jgi:nucleolar protein 56